MARGQEFESLGDRVLVVVRSAEGDVDSGCGRVVFGFDVFDALVAKAVDDFVDEVGVVQLPCGGGGPSRQAL